jgi:hypothetical protein
MTDSVRTDLQSLADGAPWPLPFRRDLRDTPTRDRAEAASSALPAGPGVAVIVGSDPSGGGPTRAVLVAATADLRAFASRRLTAEGPRADLAPLAVGVLACRAGSGFEAELAQDALSAAWTPSAHAEACSRRRPWFLVLEPAADEPVWRVVDDPPSSAAWSNMVGPFPTRNAATVFGRALDDRFELCREPRLLAQRPGATACAYKEMGRCPAACDGSEPMSAYRGRAREALAFAGRGAGEERACLERRMSEAVSSMDFETAASVRTELERLAPFEARGSAWATTIDRFRVLAVVPSGRRGWARLIACSPRGAAVLADCDARSVRGDGTARAGLLACADLACGAGTRGGPVSSAFGVLCARLASRRRTRSSFLRLEPPPAADELVGAVERAARVEAEEPGAFGGEGVPGGD